jgi:DNA-binding transcriptional LysR family regulator
MQLGAPLRAFAAFVRRGSFSGAADELRISQPAVSKHIADIERSLGVKLIERRSRTLTAAGELLAGYVLRAESILRHAARGVAALRDPAAGSLTVWSSGTPGTYVLPEVVATFVAAHPAIRVTFELGTSATVVNAVRSYKAEIGIVGAFEPAPEIDSEPLIDDEIVIVGGPGFARKKKKLTRDDFESITWISREEGSGTRAIADEAVATLSIIPRRRLALPSWEAIKLAVRRGDGVAACSRLSVEEELATGALIEIPVLPWKVRRKFFLIRIRDTVPTPATEKFLAMLRARCASILLPKRRTA